MRNIRALPGLVVYIASGLCAPAQIISTFAGTNYSFPASSPALTAPFANVQSVAVDANGNVYAADSQDNIVVRISPAGNLTVVAGNQIAGFSGDGGAATNASLLFPTGVAVDRQGNLYIADTANSRIRKVSNGIITTVAGNGLQAFSGDGGPATSASLMQPAGVAVDAAGNLYIVDADNLFFPSTPRIREVVNGTINTVAGNGNYGFSGDGGPPINASFASPQQIAFDGNGNIYIADTGNNRVRKIANGVITTVAGNGNVGLSGDGGLAVNAALSFPQGVAVDASGNLYIADTGNYRIRKVVNGMISTIAGQGIGGFSGDGGPALSASIDPRGLAVDGAGNLLIADTQNGRVRKIANGIITTVAGEGRFFGDGGAATSASLNAPFAVAIDSAGAVYIADANNNRVRKVANGVITTVAGNGVQGFSGDGGSATSAALYLPFGVAVDAANNLYIADFGNHRVRKVANGIISTFAGNGNVDSSGDGGPPTNASIPGPGAVTVDSAGALYVSAGGRVRKVASGVITTVAGNGSSGFSGDGGPAVNASLTLPSGLAVDTTGNLYIADTDNNRIRKVSNGIISTFAGNGQQGISGDGGPATSASLTIPAGVAVDAIGNVYIADTGINRVRKVSAGIITTLAGNGTTQGATPGFSGDGGLATDATLQSPYGVAVDSAGNVFVADTGNQRIREVLNKVAYRVAPASLNFSTSGGNLPVSQTLNLSTTVPGLAFSASANMPWLSISPSSGSMPAQLQVTVDPSSLVRGTYQGTVTISVPNGTPPSTSVAVTVTVGTTLGAPTIAADPASLNFSFTQGAAAGTAQLTISTPTGGPFAFSATASTTTGGNWLKVAPGTGSVSAGAPALLTITATPGSLTVGTYSGLITISSANTGQTITVPVTMAITSPPQKIVLSQLGFTFTAVAQGGTVLPQSLGILNTGAGVLNWTATISTLPPASGWLSLSATTGTVNRPFLDVSFTNVIVNASSLAPGAYYGQIQVTAQGASNSPQTALVVLTVLPAGSNPGPDTRPTGLVFTGIVGAPNPGSQHVAVANVTANPITFGSAVAYAGGGGWIKYLPTDATISPDSPAQLVVQPDFSNLTAGVRRAALTLAFDDGSVQTISILSVVAPAGTSGTNVPEAAGPLAAGCAASKLIPQFTQIGFGASSTVTVGYPATVSAKIVDDCGAPMTDGSVVVSFSNGDAPIALTSLQDGNWTNSWQPGATRSTVTVTLQANEPAAGISGTTQSLPVSAQSSDLTPPVLSDVPQSVGTLMGGAFAPGDLLLLHGIGLADGVERSSATPLKQQLAGASVVVGGRIAPLLYADSTHVVGLIPTDTPVNTSQQVILQRDNVLGIPSPLIIAATHPAILTSDGSGRGQALIYKAGTPPILADAAHPVSVGDTIVIYCTGLGAIDAGGNAINKVSVSIGSQPAQVNYAGIALPGNYPTGGAPTLLGLVSGGLGGLYQVTAAVPTGVSGSPVVVSISSAGQISQAGVTLFVTGSVSGTTPVINSVMTGGGFADIAQNDWIEIRGTNLAPASVSPNGMTWDNAPEFLSGHMPSQLGGVSVTVNGRPAFIYFVSSNQVNVLTPLDSTLGQVQIVVTSAGVSSAPYSVNIGPAAPSFPLVGGRYVVAQHSTDYSLVGPVSLSTPGYPFTPAKPTETILIYAFGFSLPTSTLSNGSSSQFGPLPTLPVIKIGGQPATVLSAYVINPGLYQFNVVVPANAPDGDNAVTCTYMGQTSPVNDFLTIQH